MNNILNENITISRHPVECKMCKKKGSISITADNSFRKTRAFVDYIIYCTMNYKYCPDCQIKQQDFKEWELKQIERIKSLSSNLAVQISIKKYLLQLVKELCIVLIFFALYLIIGLAILHTSDFIIEVIEGVIR